MWSSVSSWLKRSLFGTVSSETRSLSTNGRSSETRSLSTNGRTLWRVKVPSPTRYRPGYYVTSRGPPSQVRTPRRERIGSRVPGSPTDVRTELRTTTNGLFPPHLFTVP